MPRLFPLALAGLLLAVPTARAADGPAGFWKVPLPIDRGRTLTLLVAFSEDKGKWVGDFVGASLKMQAEPKVTDLAVKDGQVKFGLMLGTRELVSFDGVVAKDGKKIRGSIRAPGSTALQLIDLYPSKLKTVDDPFEVAREDFTQQDGMSMFDTGFVLVENAAAKKLKPEEVRGIADRMTQAAPAFGPRWERSVTLRLATALAPQAGMADVALAQARRAERMLTDDDDAATRMEVLDTLATALTRAGKADEAKPYAAQLAKLEARDFQDYAKKSITFAVEPAARKGKGDRTALVEVFTGAECPPCAAVDLAFDALMKTYKPADVVLLQYHYHVPQPDPLTSPEGAKRVEFYGDKISGLPTVFVNGKAAAPGGGSAAGAEKKYAELRKPIEEQLDKPAGVKLTLTAAKGEKGVTAKAAVTDLEMPGEKVVLRFALAEERVRFAGGNGIRYHHMVVRGMPGGAKGFALTKKTHEQTVTVDPDAVRAELTKYLDDFAKNEGEFPRADRPMALKNLKLVAFVQNDATSEVLTAVQIDLDGK